MHYYESKQRILLNLGTTLFAIKFWTFYIENDYLNFGEYIVVKLLIMTPESSFKFITLLEIIFASIKFSFIWSLISIFFSLNYFKIVS